MGPVAPKTVCIARLRAWRPAPRALTSVPSTSKRKRRTSGREPAQATDHARQEVEEDVDLGGRGPASEGEAKGAVGLFASAPDGAQHVRRLAGGPRAGRPGGGSHAA